MTKEQMLLTKAAAMTYFSLYLASKRPCYRHSAFRLARIYMKEKQVQKLALDKEAVTLTEFIYKRGA